MNEKGVLWVPAKEGTNFIPLSEGFSQKRR